MAQTPVTLKIDTFAEREVMMVTYSFNQSTDIEGQMAGIPRGGFITIKVKALNDGNNELFGWMIDPAGPKDGTIEFLNTVNNQKMKDIKFESAYCIGFTETWEEGTGHSEEIIISCKSIEIPKIKYSSKWA
jgi:hypothetical protein